MLYTSDNNKLTIALFKNNNYVSHPFSDFVGSCDGPISKMRNPVLSQPHSVSLIDLDGDCLADLFLTLEEADDSSQKYL